ncbi:MAG: BlaI/MecI/CopY family transcriptional regulator [Lachnospiraceae bacterium]|nr:BlaI/MecI/CopY family transcriptional regulator [Lachnospiraceae bacterium]
MLKKKDILNKREEELMNYLWEIKKPLTASEMAKQLEAEGWTNITLCRTVQSLSDNGYLEVAGLEKTVKTYARKLTPSLTKEEYYSSVLMNRGINANSLADITAALIGVSRKNPREKDAEVIAKLEEVIASLKSEQHRDQ